MFQLETSVLLENIGAVRELSAMTTTLGTRVDQLETSVKMSDMKRSGVGLKKSMF